LVKVAARAELRDQLERLQALMRSSRSNADLGAVIEAAVSEKLERLEARRFGRTKTPRKAAAESKTSPSSRHVPAAVRRAVHERDGGQCTFVDARGNRCTERHQLEFHHAGTPYGRGGEHSVRNIRLACRPHNAYLAELEYGKDVMERYRRPRDHVSERLLDRRPLTSPSPGGGSSLARLSTGRLAVLAVLARDVVVGLVGIQRGANRRLELRGRGVGAD